MFTTQTVLTVALGAVGITAVYPLLHDVVLRPLPYSDPDRLVTVRTSLDQQLLGVTVPEFFLLSDQTDLFEEVGAFVPAQYFQSVTWTDVTPPEPLRGMRATAGLMHVLGVGVSGPGFDADAAGEEQVLLSHGFWQSRFGGDPSVVGQAMSLNNRMNRIVGILPADFEFPLSPESYDVWTVFWLDPAHPVSSDNRIFRPVARLQPDVSMEEARARVPDLLTEFHEREATGIHVERVSVRSVHEDLVGPVRTPLLLLGGAAVLVLVIASLNVGLLISARNLARQRELAVRRAIGAGRGRVARFLLTEATLVTLAGLLVGAVISSALFAWVASTTSLSIVRADTNLDGARILGAWPAVLAVLVVSIAAALIPALRASRAGSLSSRSHGTNREVRRMTGWIVGTESALVFGLLVAAAVTLVSLEALTRVDPGFDPGGSVAVEIKLPDGQYEDTEPATIFQTIEEHLGTLPGVRRVGSVTHLPLDENNWGGSFAIEGRSDMPPDDLPGVDWEFASPGYFEAAGIPVLDGKAFTTADTRDSPPLAIINETLARRFWPNSSPIGARANGNGFDGTWFTVVGVVGDVKQQGLNVDSRGYFYMSSLQTVFVPWPERQIVIRTEFSDALSIVPDVRRTLFALEPDITIGSVTALDEIVRQASAAFRLRAMLFGGFGLIAALLGTAGIYGVVNHGVHARKREVGIRLAVGADAPRVFRMIVMDGLRPVVFGIGGGLLLVWMTAPWLNTFLFGIEAGSPLILSGIIALLLSAALAATIPPALRARRLNPIQVLQSE
jgi:putative ABC transport system permease protein